MTYCKLKGTGTLGDTIQSSEDELDDEEDLVLNLTLDEKPYIVPVGLDSLFTVGKYLKRLGSTNGLFFC